MKILILFIGLLYYLFGSELEIKNTFNIDKESCYDIGYKYGSCVMRSYKGLTCKPGTDIAIPPRCKNKSETRAGIKAGIYSEK